MILKDIFFELEKHVPLTLQEEWDNSGFQLKLHDDNYVVNKVLVTLEITNEVIKEAKINNVDLIITHHPLIFNSLNSIDVDKVTGQYIKELVSNNISVYSSHTCFDKCDGGNNTFFGRVLGFNQIDKFNNDEQGYGRFGEFPNPVSINQLIPYICDKFNIHKDFIKYAGPNNLVVKKVGWVTGAGSDFIELAKKNNCDLYITGDLTYHKARLAREIDMPTLDISHYGSEKIFEINMSYLLKIICKNEMEVLTSNLDTNPFMMV